MAKNSFSREEALAICDELTAQKFNVVIVVLADPHYTGSSDDDNDVIYSIDLTRNTGLDAGRVAQIASVLEGHNATVEFPSMQVVSTQPQEGDESGGGLRADNGDLIEPPAPEPA